MANALSNGYRKQPVEHNEKKRFVFGSSTPRDLSYMYSIPTIRNYDSKMKPIKQVKDQTLSYYMRQARSITRNQSGKKLDPLLPIIESSHNFAEHYYKFVISAVCYISIYNV
ncbi:unnamed protein product [Brugia pahangi]|uniref:Ovule protein n=1 Tax=Brugia pahangi TaxID=6280 RepID=A0A0N4TPN6_BRUPA|nr:unnamed protein product [Brugia pahangi]